MSMDREPAAGDAVIYHDPGFGNYAAVVTAVRYGSGEGPDPAGRVDLKYFDPDWLPREPAADTLPGRHIQAAAVPFHAVAAAPETRSWSWPE